MALFHFILPFLLFVPIVNCQLLPIVDSVDPVQTYIVHVQKPVPAKLLTAKQLKRWHTSFLPNTTLSSGEPRLVYSYRHAISGFAARLAPDEVRSMESVDGFLHAQPEDRLSLHTTYTPEFLGLNDWSGAWTQSLHGEGIVVGVIDTGIYPAHPSFRDDGMPPPPTWWRGRCALSSCNNKLIGAQAFAKGTTKASPLDTKGHGTHVAGIAAGNFVDDAQVLGLASGTAPKAHLAIYKVCSESGCEESDVLAGIDRAILDGVDVLSVSLGGPPRAMHLSGVAIGSFAAIKKGIIACASAGNLGPRKSMLSNDAPWVLTVGAGSVDRRMRVTVKLGNGVELAGESAYQPNGFSPVFLPIAFPGLNGDLDALNCSTGSLDDFDVRGKIVLCYDGGINDIDKGSVVKEAGGAAMVVMNHQSQGFTVSAEPHNLPSCHLSYIDGRQIRTYIYESTNSTPTAAIIFDGTVFGVQPSPTVASFSSRGPSLMNGGILKPDVIAPGVNILSAWPFELGPHPSSHSAPTFNFQSGTSFAVAHVSGIVALIKNKHPHWSSAAIQSAIITSANTLDLVGNPIFDESSYNASANLFATGSGYVNPERAMDPGLVYDISPKDYVHYLCGLGYTNKQVSAINQGLTRCNTSLGPEQLNYPSISLSLGSTITKIITRAVTNVGDARSVYWAQIDEPEGVRVDLSHYKLHFSRLYQEESFDIQFSIKGTYQRKGRVSRGRLTWVSNKRTVSSPISVTFN